MQATILSNRRGIRVQNEKQYLLSINDPEKYKTKKEVVPLLGKKVIYTTSTNKKIKGKIIATHGNKGVIRAKFEKGLPGTAIGETVTIN
ncbi:MAG TPA: 50S ribosomal protein L35ae [archaeon]|nr:50S ribosomal protein L35ae [archaeon]